MDNFQSSKHQVFSKSVCNILKQRPYIHDVRWRGARIDSAPPPLWKIQYFFRYMRDPFPAFSPCGGRFATFFSVRQIHTDGKKNNNQIYYYIHIFYTK